MILYSSYLLDDIARSGGRDAVAAGLARNVDFVTALRGPHGNLGTYGQVDGLGITRIEDPERRRAAVQWVSFLLTEGYGRLCAMSPGGKIPVRRTNLAAWRGDPHFAAFPPDLPPRLAAALDGIQRWGRRRGRFFPLITDLYAQRIFPALLGEFLDGRLPLEETQGWLEKRIRHLSGSSR